MAITIKSIKGEGPHLIAYDEQGNQVAEVFGLSMRHAKDNMKKALGQKREIDNVPVNKKPKKHKKQHNKSSMLTGVERNSQISDWNKVK